jgi:hypothetical protein
MTTQANIKRIIDYVGNIGNGKTCIEPVNDSDVGVKLLCWTDADGGQHKVLAKDEDAKVKSFTTKQNVKYYGAKGDGSTDDTAAIQSAIDSYPGTLHFPQGTYIINSKLSISISNLRLSGDQAIIRVVRPVEDAVDIENNYGIYISGDANQNSVSISGINFDGSGYWGGIYSEPLKIGDGWGAGGYPNIDEDDYTTTRTNFSISNCTFDGTYFEPIRLTNVQCNVSSVSISNVNDDSNQGAIQIRNTNDISLDNINVDTFTYKAINTNYSDGVRYSNIVCRNGGSGTSLDFYFGHFNRNCSIVNCHSYGGYSPLKVSYNATNVSISNCTFDGSGFAFLQGCSHVTVSNCVIRSSGNKCLQFDVHNTYSPTLSPEFCIVDACEIVSTEDGSVEPLVLDTSNALNTIVSNCKIVGNVYSRIGGTVSLIGCDIDYSTAYPTPNAAVYLRDLRGYRMIGCRVSTDISNSSVYCHGSSSGVFDFEMIGNTIDNNSSAATEINYASGGTLTYADNTMVGTLAGAELTLGGSFSGVTERIFKKDTRKTYSLSNISEDRAIDADATTLDEVADVLGTLINDLKITGVIQ